MSYLKFSFLVLLIYVNFIGWSSNNWIMIWFVMEISFVFFVGLVSVNMSYSIVELIMKYYIIQVFVSLLFISLLLVWSFNLGCYNVTCLVVVLMMKLGMFPFHFWLIMVLGKLNWFSFFTMVSFLKLLPILMFYYLSVGSSVTLILGLSVVAGSIMGLGNLMIQKLVGYSSLVHLCWLLVSLFFSLKLFFIYFVCYLVMMYTLVLIFDFFDVYYVNQFKFISGSFISKFIVFFLVLSLGGFPPFMGFVVKWILISFFLLFDMKVLLSLMICFSLFSVVFYLELFFYIMMISSSNSCWFGGVWKVWSYGVVLILGFYVILLICF